MSCIEKLTWLGISGIANVLCCIKMAKYYELTERDVVGTVLTDSAVMYGSRIQELNEQYGAYTEREAALDHAIHMLGLKTDSMMELNYQERKRVHNLKYYTWVEQQGKTSEELERPVVRHRGHLGRRSRPGQGSGRTHQRLQRGDRRSEEPVKPAHYCTGTAVLYDIFKGGRADARPPCLFEKEADMKNVLYGKVRQVRKDL